MKETIKIKQINKNIVINIRVIVKKDINYKITYLIDYIETWKSNQILI